MCTLTFYPKGPQWLVTFNRDERKERPAAQPPQVYDSPQGQLWYPRDPQGGGTWFAVNITQNRISCLMNGGYVRHVPQPPYRRSRGLIVLEALTQPDLETWMQGFEGEGMEPFTLMNLDYAHQRVEEYRWTGKVGVLTRHSARVPQIWASATLYEGRGLAWRRMAYQNLLAQHPELTPEQVWNFHLQPTHTLEGEGVCLQTPHGGTVSVTQAQISSSSLQLRYQDLLGNETHNRAF